MSILKSYKKILRLQLILGLCSFRVNQSQTTIDIGFWPTFSSIARFLLFSILLIYSSILTFTSHGFIEHIKTTVDITILLESCTVILVFIVTTSMALLQRKQEINLLIRIHTFDELILAKNKEFGHTNMPDRYYYLDRMFWEHLISLCIYGVFNILGINLLFQYNSFVLSIFYYCFTWALIVITLSVLQVRTFGNIVVVLGSHLCRIGHSLTASDCFPVYYSNANVIANLNALTDLCELVGDINRCFGYKLLLNAIKDFVFGTISIFVLVQRVNRLSVYNWLFLLFYILPTVIKQSAIVQILDKLGDQVSVFVIHIQPLDVVIF